MKEIRKKQRMEEFGVFTFQMSGEVLENLQAPEAACTSNPDQNQSISSPDGLFQIQKTQEHLVLGCQRPFTILFIADGGCALCQQLQVLRVLRVLRIVRLARVILPDL